MGDFDDPPYFTDETTSIQFKQTDASYFLTERRLLGADSTSFDESNTGPTSLCRSGLNTGFTTFTGDLDTGSRFKLLCRLDSLRYGRLLDLRAAFRVDLTAMFR